MLLNSELLVPSWCYDSECNVLNIFAFFQGMRLVWQADASTANKMTGCVLQMALWRSPWPIGFPDISNCTHTLPSTCHGPPHEWTSMCTSQINDFNTFFCNVWIYCLYGQWLDSIMWSYHVCIGGSTWDSTTGHTVISCERSTPMRWIITMMICLTLLPLIPLCTTMTANTTSSMITAIPTDSLWGWITEGRKSLR